MSNLLKYLSAAGFIVCVWLYYRSVSKSAASASSIAASGSRSYRSQTAVWLEDSTEGLRPGELYERSGGTRSASGSAISLPDGNRLVNVARRN